MRQERTVQASIFDLFAEHEIGRELKAMSRWLDEHRELLGSVRDDLRRQGVKETGREGLPAESVLRCALLKQHRQLSYEELAFISKTRPRFAPLRGCRLRGRRRSRCCTRPLAPSGPKRGRRSIASC
jgi:IS5 family transposase